MDIAKRIRILRGKLSQDEFAERVNIHKSSLGRYERSESLPDSEFLSRVCTEFAISAEWLLLGRGVMSQTAQAAQAAQATPAGGGPAGEVSLAVCKTAACARCAVLEAEVAGLREASHSYKEALWACRLTIEVLQRQITEADVGEVVRMQHGLRFAESGRADADVPGCGHPNC